MSDEWRLEAYEQDADEPFISVYHRPQMPPVRGESGPLDLVLAVELRVMLGDDRVARIVLERMATPVAVAP